MTELGGPCADRIADEALKLLRVWGGAPVRDAFAAPPQTPLVDLIAFGDRHQIGFALGEALAATHAAFGARGVAALLAPAQAARAARAEAFRAQFQDIAARLAANGVMAVALKGAAHLAAAGGAVPWREMVDFDLLTPPEALPTAVAALKSAGYRGDDAAFLPGSDYHYPALFPPEGPATVELHARLGWARGGLLDARAIIARARATALPGIVLPAPGDRLAHLIHHAMIADRGHACRALRLRDALDWRRLGGDDPAMRRQLDARFQAAGLKKPFQAFVALMDRIWANRRPDDRQAAWVAQTLAGLSDPAAVARRRAQDQRWALVRALASPAMRAHLLGGAFNDARRRRLLKRLRR